jgi:hypothetical protein
VSAKAAEFNSEELALLHCVAQALLSERDWAKKMGHAAVERRLRALDAKP